MAKAIISCPAGGSHVSVGQRWPRFQPAPVDRCVCLNVRSFRKSARVQICPDEIKQAEGRVIYLLGADDAYEATGLYLRRLTGLSLARLSSVNHHDRRS